MFVIYFPCSSTIINYITLMLGAPWTPPSPLPLLLLVFSFPAGTGDADADARGLLSCGSQTGSKTNTAIADMVVVVVVV
jgi:hypothetical protein